MSALNQSAAATDAASFVVDEDGTYPAGENEDLIAGAANESVAQQVRETALAAASEGLPLFPLNAGQKFPPPKGWQAIATTDANTISRWLMPLTSGSDLISDAPPNIGVLCGNGLMVFDLDPRNGSDESFTALEKKYGKLPTTRTAKTPSGGTHYYFKVPLDRTIRNDNRGKVGAGIDIKSTGGYVVLPGSRTEKGSYSWVDPTAPIAELPAQLLELVTKPGAPKAVANSGEAAAEIPTAAIPMHNLTIANARELLTHLDADSDYDTWFNICTAFHRAAKGAQDSSTPADWFAALNAWCARSPKYSGTAEVEEKWRQADTRESGYGLVYLLGLAKPSGYEPPARVADLAAFPPVPEESGREQEYATVGHAVVLVRASDVKLKKYDWLWSGYLVRGKFHVVAGAPSGGKTTAMLKLCATVSSGGVWPDGVKAKVGQVLIWSSEDDFNDTLAPRLKAMGANLENVHFIDGVVDALTSRRRSFDPATDMPALHRALHSIGDVSLILIDPVVSFVTGDSHKNAEVRRGLQPLVDLAQECGAALIGISHFTKGTSGRDPVERVTGSLAFGALARVVFAVAKHVDEDSGETERIFVRAKSNIGPSDGGFKFTIDKVHLPAPDDMDATAVTWGDALEGTAQELLKEAEGTGESSKNEDAAELIQDTIRIKGGEASATDLHEALKHAGIGKHSRYRAIDGLLEQHRIARLRYVENGPWMYMFKRRGVGVADVSAFDPAAADDAANCDLTGGAL